MSKKLADQPYSPVRVEVVGYENPFIFKDFASLVGSRTRDHFGWRSTRDPLPKPLDHRRVVR